MRGETRVVLADAEHVVSGAPALLDAALHLARRPDRDPDLGHDEADGTPGAGRLRHDPIGPAVLGGHDVPVRRHVAQRERGRHAVS